MTTNSTSSTSPLSLLSQTPITPSASATAGASTTSFDQQLSQALSDSLSRLGLSAGQVNISIRNSAGSLHQRQIVITYDDDAASTNSTPQGTSTAGSGSSTPSTSTSSSAAAGAGSSSPAPPSSPNPAVNPFWGLMPVNSKPAAAAAALDEPMSTDWSPYAGPRDQRDAIPAGGGKLTSTGAPDIQMNAAAARNQYNYTGPAASNPYFTNPGNPLRDGYVLGFGSWFKEGSGSSLQNGSGPVNKAYFSTEEGSKEALRLVQQYAPGATLAQTPWGGGPLGSSVPMWTVNLPNGKILNAGGILNSYYNGGSGVTIGSDLELERTVLSV